MAVANELKSSAKDSIIKLHLRSTLALFIVKIKRLILPKTKGQEAFDL